MNREELLKLVAREVERVVDMLDTKWASHLWDNGNPIELKFEIGTVTGDDDIGYAAAVTVTRSQEYS